MSVVASLPDLDQRVRARALALGFARVGVARAEALEPEASRLNAWLDAGRHGEMTYMEETRAVRADVRHEGMLRSARSVIMVATSYRRAEPVSGPEPARIARYALGRDYHNVLGKRVKKLAKFVRAEGYNARGGVDSLPIFERAWAQRAGLGFIGKNCCLIVPGLGSHVLLAAVITNAVLTPDPPMKERCGACRACLDACPTRAFVGPRELDARRCISYLTIEQRGAIPLELRSGVGHWAFGCDACQDVCPFNRTRALPAEQTALFAPHERWSDTSLGDVLAMDEARFEAFAQGTPLSRPGRAGMARNAAVVLGNVGTRRHLPVLAQAAARDTDAIVRETAAWAVAAIEARVAPDDVPPGAERRDLAPD